MLSVHQFVSHLDTEAQGTILVSQEAFLAFLRERFTEQTDDSAQVRRDLYAAARDQLEGKRVLVDAMPDERWGAQAVIYAVCKLADRLQETQPEKPATLQIYTDANQKLEGSKTLKRWRAGYNGAGGWATKDDLYPRISLTVSFTANDRETVRLNVRADNLEQTLEDVKTGRGFSRRYVAAIANAGARGERLGWHVSHPRSELLARRMLLEARRMAKRCPKLSAPARFDPIHDLEPRRAPELPKIEVHPEVLEVSQTLHFDASSRETGYARIVLDGEDVGRVRCWNSDESESMSNPEIDLIRGGTIRRVAKPDKTWALRPNEVRVIELERGILAVREDQLAPTAKARVSETHPWFMTASRRGSERYYGRGTRTGEVWLRGTADREVMALYANRLMARVSGQASDRASGRVSA